MIKKLILSIFITLVVFAVLFVGTLQLPPVRRALAKEVASRLGEGATIGKLIIYPPFYLSADDVEVDGLQIDRVTAVWSPWALLRGTLAFSYVEIGKIEFTGSGSGGVSESSLPFPIEVEKFVIQEPPLSGRISIGKEIDAEVNVEDVSITLLGKEKFETTITYKDFQVEGELQIGRSGFEFVGDEVSVSGKFGEARISDINFQVNGHSEVKGELNFESGRVFGKFQGEIDDLGRWGLVDDLDGEATFSLELTEKGELNFDLKSGVVKFRSLIAHDIALRADLAALFETPSGKIDGKFRDLRFGFAEISQGEFTSQFEGGSGDFSGTVRNGGFSGSWKKGIVTLAKLEGNLSGERLSLVKPTTFTSNSLSPFELITGRGKLKGHYLPQNDNPIALRATDFPLPMLDFLLPGLLLTGQVSGDLNLDKAAFSWEAVRLQDPGFVDFGPIRGQLKAKRTDDDLQIHVDARGIEARPFDFDLTLPLNVEKHPLTFEIPRGGEISGSANLEAQMGPILEVILPATFQVNALVSAHANFSGTAGDPRVEGKASIANGRVDDTTSGASFQKVSAELEGMGRELHLTSLTTTDGDGGRFSATGQIELKPSEQFPFFVEGKFDRFRIVRLDPAETTASGTVSIGGTILYPEAKGELRMDKGAIHLAKRLPVSIPNFPVTFINVPAADRIDIPPADLEQVKIALDIAIDVPDTLVVEGRGLNSLWKGKLDLRGTNETPELFGSLDMEKGEFVFADKVFKGTHGKVIFDGPPAEKNTIELTGRLDVDDVEIDATLTGTLPNVTLAFQSSAAFSEQDIYAYILFGGPASEIGPLQAVELARVAAQVSGGQFGPDILGGIQKTVGLDRLLFTSPPGTSEEVGIQAGKKIAKNVNVNIYRSINQTYNRLVIELDLYREFKIAGEMGNEESDRISLRWRKNY